MWGCGDIAKIYIYIYIIIIIFGKKGKLVVIVEDVG